jgi:hypothetical protein
MPLYVLTPTSPSSSAITFKSAAPSTYFIPACLARLETPVTIPATTSILNRGSHCAVWIKRSIRNDKHEGQSDTKENGGAQEEHIYLPSQESKNQECYRAEFADSKNTHCYPFDFLAPKLSRFGYLINNALESLVVGWIWVVTPYLSNSLKGSYSC